jgi:hypothetical protein
VQVGIAETGELFTHGIALPLSSLSFVPGELKLAAFVALCRSS